MNRYRQLVAIAADQHGLVTSAGAAAAGVQPVLLVQMARRGVLDTVARGIYRVPELAGDPLAQYQEALLLLPGAVLSHETALDLHDLCDVNPGQIHVTVAAGTRIRKALPGWLAVHRGPLEPDDVTGHDGLAIVTPARSIVDGITSALGDRFVDQAIGTARERNLLTVLEEQGVELARRRERARQLRKALAT
jgi:predicted transcriptional regulator of viral defense system